MHKFNTFARSLRCSIVSPAYYHDIATAPFRFSLKYFFGVMLLLAMITTAYLGFLIVTELPPILTRVQEVTQSAYPPDLVIELQEGRLHINRDDPFIVPFPERLIADPPPAIPDSQRINLFVYDTGAGVRDFAAYNTLLLATKTSIMVADAQDDVQVFSLQNRQDVRITKSDIDHFLSRVLPLVDSAVPLAIAAVFVVSAVFVPIARLLSLIIPTVIIMLVGRMIIGLKQYRYATYLQFGLHSITLPLLVNHAMWILDIPQPFNGFFSTFFILYTLVILAHLKSVHGESVS